MILKIFSSRVKYSQQAGFDSDGSSVIVYNYENVHILPEEDMFTDKIDPIINGAENIGKNDIFPKGIGTVRWYWTYDEAQLQTKKCNTVIQFIG